MPIACDNTGNEKIMVRNLQLLMKPFIFLPVLHKPREQCTPRRIAQSLSSTNTTAGCAALGTWLRETVLFVNLLMFLIWEMFLLTTPPPKKKTSGNKFTSLVSVAGVLCPLSCLLAKICLGMVGWNVLSALFLTSPTESYMVWVFCKSHCYHMLWGKD